MATACWLYRHRVIKSLLETIGFELATVKLNLSLLGHERRTDIRTFDTHKILCVCVCECEVCARARKHNIQHQRGGTEAYRKAAIACTNKYSPPLCSHFTFLISHFLCNTQPRPTWFRFSFLLSLFLFRLLHAFTGVVAAESRAHLYFFFCGAQLAHVIFFALCVIWDFWVRSAPFCEIVDFDVAISLNKKKKYSSHKSSSLPHRMEQCSRFVALTLWRFSKQSQLGHTVKCYVRVTACVRAHFYVMELALPNQCQPVSVLFLSRFKRRPFLLSACPFGHSACICHISSHLSGRPHKSDTADSSVHITAVIFRVNVCKYRVRLTKRFNGDSWVHRSSHPRYILSLVSFLASNEVRWKGLQEICARNTHLQWKMYSERVGFWFRFKT